MHQIVPTRLYAKPRKINRIRWGLGEFLPQHWRIPPAITDTTNTRATATDNGLAVSTSMPGIARVFLRSLRSSVRSFSTAIARCSLFHASASTAIFCTSSRHLVLELKNNLFRSARHFSISAPRLKLKSLPATKIKVAKTTRARPVDRIQIQFCL